MSPGAIRCRAGLGLPPSRRATADAEKTTAPILRPKCWPGLGSLSCRLPSHPPVARTSASFWADTRWQELPILWRGAPAADVVLDLPPRPPSELVAGGRAPDQPPNQPTAAECEWGEHVLAAVATNLGLGGGPIVSVLLRETPRPGGHLIPSQAERTSSRSRLAPEQPSDDGAKEFLRRAVTDAGAGTARARRRRAAGSRSRDRTPRP